MNLADTMQKFQDWFTQQWVIICGRKINPFENSWLMGSFGDVNGIGEKFIYKLAEKEDLIIVRNSHSKGLLDSILSLNLQENEIKNLSKKVVEFYEKTSEYKLQLNIKWNPIFRILGYIVNRLFSQRINQLNIPTNNVQSSENLTSEIIELVAKNTNEVKYKIWLRKFQSTGKVIYSGIYTTCTLPLGTTCVKAIFPLPNGNATVILKPYVGERNELILDSSGNKFGDAGFYFLVNDSKGNYYSKYIKSFTDKLIVSSENGRLTAEQTLKLWNLKVARFEYKMKKQTR
ncbi:hypothetical protein [Riemerella anatipestifer]|uniref:hypothetical protein n=1 Tax=Riemerella anatipestifer TaxID=34085 RepID=UPI00286088BB|nr:hypothetical protein [Riemerella anatipestifer]MDR7673127.1 hypothetical protein [Riemerella anatipestifer]MDR7693120.1 hypothetical protein [Riemerella anatipestifer]MDR7699878.1 hypothetical protein [Riemerella anatipestifer]MDR7707501.1 hypothetical protein [Riemerella anatipestifer]MDR7709595.1 hypothetical protein [Riemerella anatipestifer]